MAVSGTTICKLVFIVVIGAVTMLSGLAPMKIQGCNTNPKLMGIANSFSGGVFLAIAFCHILPETSNLYYRNKLEKMLDGQREAKNPDHVDLEMELGLPPAASQKLVTQEEIDTLIDDYQSSFPLPYLLVVLGYAFILLIDRVIIDSHSVDAAGATFDIESSRQSSVVNTPKQQDISGGLEEREERSSFTMRRQRSRSMGRSEKRVVDINGDGDGDDNMIVEDNEAEDPASKEERQKERRRKRKQEALKEQLNAYLKKQDKFAGAMHNILVEHKQKLKEDRQTLRNKNSSTFTPPNQQQSPNFFIDQAENGSDQKKRTRSDPECGPNEQLIKEGELEGAFGIEFENQTAQDEIAVEEATKGICAGFNLQSCVLMLALTMHAIFEGIALGLTNEFSATVNIMLALALHKPAAAMSLGVSITKNFVEKNEANKGILLLSIFAAATPVGILIGMALQSSSDIVEVIFNSFAGGTFLYIAASEVIVEEFSIPDRYKWLQYGAFLCGIALISSLWFIEA